MYNPFLQDVESTHEYKGKSFVVDFYPNSHRSKDGTWQCSDGSHIVRARAETKEKAIQEAHERWDKYVAKNPDHF